MHVSHSRILENGYYKVSLGYTRPLAKCTDTDADLHGTQVDSGRNGMTRGINHSS